MRWKRSLNAPSVFSCAPELTLEGTAAMLAFELLIM